MKKKIIVIGICILFAFGISACGQAAQEEAAPEEDLVVVEEETVVATVQKPVEVAATKAEAKKETKVNEVVAKTEPKKEQSKKEEKASAEAVADGIVDESDFAVEINGVVVKLREDINELSEDLGEPDDFEEAQSCLHDGKDKIYYYGGITVYTYPDVGKDIVNIIEFNGEEKTLSGIGIGSTKAEIEEAYGADYIEEPSYITYEYSDNATISFEMDGEECVYIELYWE